GSARSCPAYILQPLQFFRIAPCPAPVSLLWVTMSWRSGRKELPVLREVAGEVTGRIRRSAHARSALRSGTAVSVSARPSLRLRPLACATGYAAVRSCLTDPLPDGELGQGGNRGSGPGTSACSRGGSPPGSRGRC